MIKPLLVILTLTNLVVILLLIWQFEYTEIKGDHRSTDYGNDFRNVETNELSIDQKIGKDQVRETFTCIGCI